MCFQTNGAPILSGLNRQKGGYCALHSNFMSFQLVNRVDYKAEIKLSYIIKVSSVVGYKRLGKG